MSKMISVKFILISLHNAEEEIQNEINQRLECGRGATDWQSETLSLIRHWIKRLSVYDHISLEGKLFQELFDDFYNQSASCYLLYLL